MGIERQQSDQEKPEQEHTKISLKLARLAERVSVTVNGLQDRKETNGKISFIYRPEIAERTRTDAGYNLRTLARDINANNPSYKEFRLEFELGREDDTYSIGFGGNVVSATLRSLRTNKPYWYDGSWYARNEILGKFRKR